MISLTFLHRIRQEWEQAQAAVLSQFEELQAQLVPSLTTHDATTATVAALGVSVVPTLATGVGLTLSAFTSGGFGTWQVTAANVLNWSYGVLGPRILLDFYVNATTVTAPLDVNLQINLPNNYTVARYASNACTAIDNGTFVTARVLATPGQRVIQIRRTDQANWAASSASTYVFGQLLVEVK